MKRFAFLLFGLILILAQPNRSSAISVKMGVGINYYAVNDPVFKEIYGKGNFMWSGSLGFEVIRMIELRGEANYFKANGEMTFTKENLAFTMTPLIAGIRWRVFEGRRWSPYLGTGVDFYFYEEKVPVRFEKVSESITGFHIEVGSYVRIRSGIFLDLNLRYVKADANLLKEPIKLGGYRMGIGLGYQFNL
jgi:outer membrane protein W